MTHMLKLYNMGSMKGSASLGECFAKIISEALETTNVRLIDLLKLCSACYRAYTKESQRLCLSRACITQLVQAVKFKVILAENNYNVLLRVSVCQ